MDFSLRASKNGEYDSRYLYMYFDISEMELDIKGRCSIISNIRIADNEIEEIADSIMNLISLSARIFQNLRWKT